MPELGSSLTVPGQAGRQGLPRLALKGGHALLCKTALWHPSAAACAQLLQADWQ